MNGSSDIPLQHSNTPDTRPCGLISIIPTLGMSSCRGRAEAFARRLSSKLRTLGSQTDDEPISQEDEPIINGSATNTWMTPHESEQTVTDLQPLRHESDSFFDFDCELESPGSPVDECEYLRLIETASNTPHNSAPESGYVCASAASSHSSNDGQFYDAANTDYHGITETNQSECNIDIDSAANTTDINDNEEHNTNNISNLEMIQSTKLQNGTDNIKITERFSNGHTENGDEMSEYTTDIKKQIPDEDEQSVYSMAPPLIDSDIVENTVNEEIITAKDLPSSNDVSASMQDKIINELQKESEEITEMSQEEIKYEQTNGTQEHDEVDSAPLRKNTTDQTYFITNGHTVDGEDLLKIDKIEINENEHKKFVQCEEKAVGTDELIFLPTTTAAAAATTTTPDQVDNASAIIIHPTNEQTGLTIISEDHQKETDNNNTKNHTAGLDTTDDDEEDCRPQRVRRCSSLKTGKTPPGTPGRKKIVRFADVLGLDLADVKTFLDEIPTIPKSAFEDLECMEQEPPIQLGPKLDKLLMPLFQQPGGLPTFLDIVREKQVSLENAAVTDHINQTITGCVRVRNLDFHKSVHIRYTMDGWRSFADLQANYVENSCDGFSDKFTFVLFGNSLHIGQRLEFAVRFQCKGQQFWDNNYGTNYCFQCLPTSSPINNSIPSISINHQHDPHQMADTFNPTASDAWCSSFY